MPTLVATESALCCLWFSFSHTSWKENLPRDKKGGDECVTPACHFLGHHLFTLLTEPVACGRWSWHELWWSAHFIQALARLQRLNSSIEGPLPESQVAHGISGADELLVAINNARELQKRLPHTPGMHICQASRCSRQNSIGCFINMF